MTDMEMSTFADSITANPFYQDPMDLIDDSGLDRPPELNISDMGSLNVTNFKGKTYGGTIN